jgi:hypothetical protein
VINKKMKRKSLSKKSRFEVFKRDSFTCQYCGSKAPDVILEVDHINPVSKGGDNDILNLVTSCFECNRGKGNKELSDDSIIHRQNDQLSQLNERRIQIEMMLDWKNELLSIDDDLSEKVCDYFHSLTGYAVNEKGARTMRSICKKFGYDKAIEATERAVSVYFKDDFDSVEIAFKKIGAIANVMSKSPHVQKFHYILGILRRNISYVNEKKIMPFLVHVYDEGHDLDDFTERIKAVKNWTSLRNFAKLYEYEL